MMLYPQKIRCIIPGAAGCNFAPIPLARAHIHADTHAPTKRRPILAKPRPTPLRTHPGILWMPIVPYTAKAYPLFLRV